MKNLESARVQMVEKIKSISDFIEKEIENENNKKVNKCKNLIDVSDYYNQTQAYRRKREADYSENYDEDYGVEESSGEEDEDEENVSTSDKLQEIHEENGITILQPYLTKIQV